MLNPAPSAKERDAQFPSQISDLGEIGIDGRKLMPNIRFQMSIESRSSV